ncbi:uncharacterized protein LOC120928129 [Rana temporaria]|uniref:uncharacterized protein LOC120928129 n=1 Tax=Rana temporaria TaxID=8407 RepID=UPI001AADC8CD|nr:uncharacterized protein LOC120928129 [Rana temporaria]
MVRKTAVIGLLFMVFFLEISWGLVYVRTGANVTGCDMTCPPGVLEIMELYKQCGGEEEPLLELHCNNGDIYGNTHRIHLDKVSGCWKLTQAGKDDSCVYKIWRQGANNRYPVSSTDIRVLDPVLISNITSNCSRLGEDMAVSVQFSGEESAVTWEVDGESLPGRYRLIDENRTLIIPNVQRDDAERRFRVRITNPVSEEIREYRLNDPVSRTCLNVEDSRTYGRKIVALFGVLMILILLAATVTFYILYRIHSKRDDKAIHEYVALTDGKNLFGAISENTMENGSVATKKNESEPIMKDGYMSTMGNVPGTTIENGSVVTMGKVSGTTIENGSVATMGKVSGTTIENGSVVTMGKVSGTTIENGSVATMGKVSGTTIENGSVVTMGKVSGTTIENGSVATMGKVSGTTIENGSVATMGKVSGTTIENGSVVTMGKVSGTTIENGSVATMGKVSGATVENGSVATMGKVPGTTIENGSVATMGKVSGTTIENGSVATMGKVSGTTPILL